ncbi:MAG: response regulator [Thermodesulfobacteriota bacterium]
MTKNCCGEKAKILIVEDETVVAMDLKQRLISLGYEVTDLVNTGAEAVEAAERTTPDLVLMDINLKGEMDGIEAAALIKKYSDSAVIYLTAYSDEKTLAKAKITLPFAYILKPFAERELHSNIEMALYRRSVEGELKALKGLLPICAKCKDVRDDKGYWKQIESYMSDRLEVKFTHGLCPGCAKAMLEEAKNK